MRVVYVRITQSITLLHESLIIFITLFISVFEYFYYLVVCVFDYYHYLVYKCL